MTVTVSLAALVATATVGWTIGGLLLRVMGRIGVAVGIAAALDGHAGGLGLIFAFAGMWLAGQWHYAARHHDYRSPLARRIFTQALPRRFDVTRDWVRPAG